MRVITGIITMLIVTACGGHNNRGASTADKGQSSGIDTLAALCKVEGPYADANPPDSVTLAAILRLPDLQKRGIPETMDVIGANSLFTEDRIGIFNLTTMEDITEGRVRFLELTWALDDPTEIADNNTDMPTDGEKSHIRIWYEIRPDSLIPVDTLYWHDGMEF